MGLISRLKLVNLYTLNENWSNRERFETVATNQKKVLVTLLSAKSV